MSLETEIAAIIRRELRDVIREELRSAALSGAKEFLSVSAAASLTGFSASTIKGWIREGELAAHGVGRRRRVKTEDVRRCVEQCGRAPRAANDAATPEDWAAAQVARRAR